MHLLFFAVAIRGPVDPAKVLRWFESCAREEDGTRCVKGRTEDWQILHFSGDFGGKYYILAEILNLAWYTNIWSSLQTNIWPDAQSVASIGPAQGALVVGRLSLLLYFCILLESTLKFHHPHDRVGASDFPTTLATQQANTHCNESEETT